MENRAVTAQNLANWTKVSLAVPIVSTLEKNGEHTSPECQDCDALPLYRVPICYGGAVYVRASSEKEAREFVCDMTTDKMYGKSDGTWDIDEAEQVEDE